MTQLDSIKQFTTVVADSGDIESIRHYQPEDATTNPSLLLKAAGLDAYSGLIDDAIAWAKDQAGDLPNRVEQAMLWANHRDQFQKDWYWSCEAPESGWAWFQDFRDGGQLSCYRNDELRARAVRRLIIQ